VTKTMKIQNRIEVRRTMTDALSEIVRGVSWRPAVGWLILLLVSCPVFVVAGSKRDRRQDDLAGYIARLQSDLQVTSPRPGSCWVDAGPLASLSTDYKAAVVGDLITIVVSQGLTSTNAGNVSTARTYSANSGITSLPGQASVADVTNLLALQSAETLAGKGQANSSHSLTTTLAGRVVAVLAGGNLVIEAERTINMNNEKQTITLRGLARRGDIGPDNTIASNAIGDLELEIKGKGVISNGVRPPNPVLRAIMRIVNF
jgi:flagellar L-ring protein FlgH